MDLMNLVATIALDTKNFVSGIEQAKSQASGLSSVTVAIGNLMSQGFNTAVGAVKNFAGYVLDSGKSFESTMSEVQAISGASGQDLVDLTNKAKEMGATTKFSATEAGEAFTYMAMAGWDSGQMMDGITGIMNLAAASGENLANTSDIVTDALTAFGLKAEDAGHFSDVIAAASSNANTNVSMLGESFKYVAPLAGSMKYSAEDVAVALGIMANSGIKGSQAGTTLRSILTKLIKPTKDVEAAMEQYGLSLSDSSGNALPLDNVLGQLRTTFSNLSQAEQTQLAATLAGQEGMSGLLSIVNTSQEDFDKLKNSIYDCEGATQRMADVMQNNLGGSLTILQSGVEGLALTFFDGIKGTAKDAVDGLTAAVEKANKKVSAWINSDATQEKLTVIADKIQILIDKLLNNLDPILDGIIGLFEGLVNVIGFVVDHFDQIAAVVGTVVAGFVALKAAMAAIKFASMISNIASLIASMNPVTLIIGAIIAAIAALILNWDKVKAVAIACWESIKNAWNSATSFFSNLVSSIVNAFTGIGEKIGAFFSSAWEKVKSIWSAVTSWFSSIVSAVINAFTSIPSKISEFFKKAWETIKSVWQAVTGWFASIVSAVINAFTSIPSKISDFFKKAWSTIQGIWNAVTGWFSNVVSNVINAFTSIPQRIGSFFTNAWNNVKNAWSNVTSFFSGIPNKIYSIFTSLPSRFTSIGKDIVQGLWNGINNMVGWITGKVKGFTDSVVGSFKNFFGIKSPSRVMRDEVGKYLGMGVGEGIMDEADYVQKSFNSLMPDFGSLGSASGFGASDGSVAAAGNNTYSITINVNGGQFSDERSLAEAISNELQYMLDRRKAVFA